ncbi:MAG: ABC transporter permease, partial [Planctomycetota bacterium]
VLAHKNVRPYSALKKKIAEGPLRFLFVRVLGTDNFMMRAVDILYGLPYMFLVILLLVNFGRDIVVLFIALGAVQWLTMARIVRGQVLSLKEKEFIEAARMAGAGHAALLFRHLIPNTLGIVAVYTTLTIPAVILQESFLAFIGLAVQYKGENLASWGALVDEGRQALGTGGDRWWMLIFPSLAMAATLFSLNFLGDGLRDALDPQQKGRT